jgi:GR25 family glycosyltransferase involved in LPS biosynthesis
VFFYNTYYALSKEYFGGISVPFRTFCINLDKDKSRYTTLQKSYDNSDLKQIILERYPAIVGKSIDVHKWLPPKTLNEYYKIQQRGYRTHHYQLTPGAVGCFLSHYYLAKQLVNDNTVDTYLILEDDIKMKSDASSIMNYSIQNAPTDWDIILFYTHRNKGMKIGTRFTQTTAFWGLGTYVINKKGAQKIIDEIEQQPIDGQIDSYLSRMSQQGKLHIYTNNVSMSENVGVDTNIQIKLQPVSGLNPFEYTGFIV